MKRLLLLITLLPALALTSSIVAAAPPRTDGGQFDLALTGITWRPENPRVGNEILFTVSYINQGTAPVPTDALVEITLKVFTVATQDQPAQEVGEPCSEQATGASGLKPNDRNLHSFAGCSFKPPLEGNYRVEAGLSMKNAGGAALTDPDAGNLFHVEPLAVGPYETALPDQFARLFAGLGMFMAVMAIMALGAEAVIDSGKVMFGLKSKVTALSALDQMGKILPGQLASLGVGAVSQQQLTKLTEDLRKTLEPVETVRTASEAIQRGEFAAAYTQIVKLVPAKGQAVAEDKLGDLKNAARDALGGLDRLGAKLGLPKEYFVESTKSLEEQINKVELKDSGTMLETVFGKLQEIAAKLPDCWLESQRDILLNKGRGEVLKLFDDQLRPQLEGVGLTPETVDQARQKIEVTLEAIDAKAMAATDTYVAGLKNLLQGVEERRNDMQSPLRKLWRRLRTAKHGDAAVVVSIAMVFGLIYGLFPGSPGEPVLSASLVGLPWAGNAGLLRLTIGVIVVAAVLVVVSLLLLGLGWLGAQAYPDGAGAAGSIKLSEWTNLHKIEILVNVLRGDKEIDPEKFGEARDVEKVLETKLSATTAAQALLTLTDKQRDDENSRLRWLRVLSVLVGFVLAYLLQVDAAKLLDAAVPGAGNSMNFFTLKGEDLHQFWPLLPPALNLTPGIVLTALAASAGSTFWHDQLDRLQTTKKTAEAAAQMLKQVKGGGGDSE